MSLNLKPGDRVVMTEYGTRQFRQAQSQAGVVTATWKNQRWGPLLRDRMIRVKRDGLKGSESWHHSYWRKP